VILCSKKFIFLSSNYRLGLFLIFQLRNQKILVIKFLKPFTMSHRTILEGGFADVAHTRRLWPYVWSFFSFLPLILFPSYPSLLALAVLLAATATALARLVARRSSSERVVGPHLRLAGWHKCYGGNGGLRRKRNTLACRCWPVAVRRIESSTFT
jgi:hypothetical protein